MHWRLQALNTALTYSDSSPSFLWGHQMNLSFSLFLHSNSKPNLSQTNLVINSIGQFDQVQIASVWWLKLFVAFRTMLVWLNRAGWWLEFQRERERESTQIMCHNIFPGVLISSSELQNQNASCWVWIYIRIQWTWWNKWPCKMIQIFFPGSSSWK